MAEQEAMKYLLTSLGAFINYHRDLILKADGEADQLRADLKAVNDFLSYVSTKKIKDEQWRSVRQICDAVYDAEDAVDAFVTHSSSGKSKPWWSAKLFSNPITVDKIAQKVQRIRTKLNECRKNIDEATKDAENDVNTTHADEVTLPRETNVVGFESDAETIIEHILKGSQQLGIISITGMPGLGKSTLAWKVFRHQYIEDAFPEAARLWVPVFKLPLVDVFLNILRKFTPITQEIRRMKEYELAQEIQRSLDKQKFLIVMDGVWSSADWKKISIALPTGNRLGSRILITSRHVDVALSANYQHALQPLSPEDGMRLLQLEVFGEPRWEPMFEEHGKEIARKSQGLPLVIVVAGDVIKRKFHLCRDNIGRLKEWKDFSERQGECFQDDHEGTIERAFSLSYDRLPYHLRACFLYFGMFPKDAEIPAWNLFQMWIAEGFVRESSSLNLEETAANYLKELIIMNLVTPVERNSDDKIKTCRTHTFLRNFCKKQAGMENENFLEEIRVRGGKLEPEVTDIRYRRLYIHSNIISRFVASKPSGRGVRSFVCNSKEVVTLEKKHVSAIPSVFKSLRVLDVKPAIFNEVPTHMRELLYLRYVHLSFNSTVLPRDLSKLWNIQTLIVETSKSTLEIKADIWKMRHLRHVKTNAIATLPEPVNVVAVQDAASTIATLGAISPESCTSNILNAACNLRRLTVRGKLETLQIGQSTKLGSFNHMAKLKELEKLKLQNDVLEGAARALSCLPPPATFPPKLKMLTLSNTSLDWSQMQVLGRLKKLEVLKLKDEAFTGSCWETDGEGFPCLQVLFVESPSLKDWKMSVEIFPQIMRLKLRNCNGLRVVPTEFAQRPNLSELILDNCPGAVDSAKEIGRKKMEADATFNLSII